MPTADAWVMIPKEDNGGCVLDMRPLVLCKDCKNWKEDTIERGLKEFGEEDTAECERLCRMDSWGEWPDDARRTSADWFCGDGVRRK